MDRRSPVEPPLLVRLGTPVAPISTYSAAANPRAALAALRGIIVDSSAPGDDIGQFALPIPSAGGMAVRPCKLRFTASRRGLT
jgi:hypothetical protein